MAEKILSHSAFEKHERPLNKEDAINFQKASPNGYTPLHVAVITGSIKSLNELIAEGYCELKAQNKQYKTALDMAIESKNMQMIEILLKAFSANEMQADTISTIYNLENEQFIDIILDKQENMDLSSLFFCAIDKKDYPLLSRLLNEKKVNTDIVYQTDTALSYAFDSKDAQMVKFLLDQGFLLTKALPKCIDRYAQSACFKKIAHCTNALRLIALSYIKDINEADERGDALIHYVISSSTSLEDKITWIQQLKNLNVDLSKKNSEGETPFQLIMDDWFFSFETKIALIEQLSPDVMMDPNIQKDLYKLLMKAIKEEYQFAFDFLLLHCTLEVLNSYDSDGRCPLHLAVFKQNEEMIDKLLSAGVDINKPTQKGNTCLHIMAIISDTTFLDKFIENGARTDVINDEGQRASELLNMNTVTAISISKSP